MTTWILLTANYIDIFLLIVYVAAAYLSLWIRRREAEFARCMGICRYLIHGYGFFVLFLQTEQWEIVTLYCFQLSFFLLADILQRRIYTKGIPVLYQNMMFLMSIGFLMLTRLSFESAVKQFLIAVFACCFSYFLPWILKRFPKFPQLGLLYTLIGLGLLLVVLVAGSEIFGAKNWLTIKNLTFQPSEFVKLTFILSMAALLTRESKSRYRKLCLVSVVAALHVGLLAMSNDFGGALIFFVVYLLMLFVISADILLPIAALLSGALAALLAYRYSGHIADRVMAWQNPFSCIEKEGYQVAQSLFAIGSGGWLGTGLYEGMPQTVPVVKSDFIFSAISEELGAVFAALLLCVYINCILWMLTLALERKQPFFFAVTTGAAALFGVQVFLNIGGVIRMIPSTGVTLVFISYGGSSLTGSVFLFQGIQAMRTAEDKKKGKEESGQQLRMIAVCSMVLLLLCVLTAYYIGATVTEAKEVYYNDYNRRIRETEETVRKGSILASDGTILAHTIVGENGKLYRLYPHGETAVFVTGQMLMGSSGLEQQYWKEMYTISLSLPEKIKRKWNGLDVVGNSIVTTIDMELQKVAQEALSGYQGAIGVLEVKTGKMLAMASSPVYNPNEISVQWENLLKRSDAPLLNRLTNGLYPPGSTFKLVTALAYLRQQEEESFSYVCTGVERVRNTTVHCYENKAHGKQTLKEAFANSCNTAFAVMGEQITEEAFNETAQELGFGVLWDNTLSYAKSSFFLSEDMEDAARVQAAFGQGKTLVTPFQILLLGAATANHGILKLPYLVERVENCNGETVTQYTSAGEKVLLSETEAEYLTDCMVEASKNSMWEFTQREIMIAGKTGSAETESGTHSWYLCFAPADAPQIAVVVLMEQVGTGSRYAVPAAKKLLEAYFTESN